MPCPCVRSRADFFYEMVNTVLDVRYTIITKGMVLYVSPVVELILSGVPFLV